MVSCSLIFSPPVLKKTEVDNSNPSFTDEHTKRKMVDNLTDGGVSNPRCASCYTINTNRTIFHVLNGISSLCVMGEHFGQFQCIFCCMFLGEIPRLSLIPAEELDVSKPMLALLRVLCLK